jgi:hypothetical protein
MAMSEMYDQCTPAEKKQVDAIYEKLRPIHARMKELASFTRVGGKIALPFDEAKAKEDEYAELEVTRNRLNSQLRKIYKRYAKFL